MTHRPIRPIEINGFEPGGTPRALPIFEWVDPATLLVDEGYQRAPSERSLKLIRKIVANWDWAKFKCPIVVLTDAGPEILDGQHSSIAAATHPDVDLIPIMIIEAPERADRAGSFISHNKDRVAVTALQLHIAAVAAGDDAALAVERVRERAGLKFMPAISKEPVVGETMAVAAIDALIRRHGEDDAAATLAILVEGGCAPVTQVHVKAAALLLHDPEYADLPRTKLAGVIKDMGPKAEAEARIFMAAHPSVSLYKAVAIQWFKGRRGKLGGEHGARASLDGLRENPSKGRPALVPESPVRSVAVAKPVVDDSKRDSRPKLMGWIPGPVLRRCSGCDEKYVGDLKSKSCADCAYGCREARTA